MIAIINYGVGNLGSIKNMISRLGYRCEITNSSEVVEVAEKIILPGVGSFDHGIRNLRESSFFPTLQRKVLVDKTPILGVCLGVQLFTESSEEGQLPGLAWINGKTVRFDTTQMQNHNLKVPHMGWSNVHLNKDSKLFKGFENDPRFYFVHSYHLLINDKKDALVSSKYGYDFVAGIEKENILGVQFHPEKSHKFGFKLYENFIQNY